MAEKKNSFALESSRISVTSSGGREREREREREKERERVRQGERENACVCIEERERKRERGKVRESWKKICKLYARTLDILFSSQ